MPWGWGEVVDSLFYWPQMGTFLQFDKEICDYFNGNSFVILL